MVGRAGDECIKGSGGRKAILRQHVEKIMKVYDVPADSKNIMTKEKE